MRKYLPFLLIPVIVGAIIVIMHLYNPYATRVSMLLSIGIVFIFLITMFVLAVSGEKRIPPKR